MVFLPIIESDVSLFAAGRRDLEVNSILEKSDKILNDKPSLQFGVETLCS